MSVIISGVLVFAFSQFILKFVIDPILEQRRVIGEITFSMMYYAHQYANPGSGHQEDMDEASGVLRKNACQLTAVTNAIPLYNFWALLRWVLPEKNTRETIGYLIGLSNSIHNGNAVENNKSRKEIEKNLRIKLS